MMNTKTLESSRSQTKAQPLICRLRHAKHNTREDPVPHMAEMELENISEAPLEISYRMAVLQYLQLVVRDAKGSVISEGHYGDRFSPFEKDQVLRLGPGEKYH